MKTPSEIIKEIRNDACHIFYDVPNCSCERCKTGLEVFLTNKDIEKIQLDTLTWCLEKFNDNDRLSINLKLESLKNNI